MPASDVFMQSMDAETQLAIRRQGDGAAFDMRMLGGVLAGDLIASKAADINAAVRTPTTLGLGVPEVNPPLPK